MHSPVRVPFGLRSYATDSESGSWPGSDLSSLPSVSDDDSLCGEFHCESDLRGFDGRSIDSGTTPKTTTVVPQRHKRAEVPIQRSKESWSEIDERARCQEREKPQAKGASEPPARNHMRHNRSGNHHRNRRNDPRTPSNSDKSENWRSKPSPKRRQDRRRSDKRRPRMDPPLKGAVVRPYTLPSGPITVLRRPPSDAQCTADATNTKLPGTSELEHLGFVEDLTGHLPPQEAKENDRCHNAPSGSNARVVTTRFGEGFLVENPSTIKSDISGDTPPFKGTEMKVARNAAMMAMAGLSMGSRDAKDTDLRSWDSSVSAETYDRSLGGFYKRPQPKRPSKRSKDSPPIKTGMYSDRRGARTRHNVFIGRRPKLETRHVREDDFLVGE